MVGPGAVPFRRHQHPHQPELAHPGQDVVRIAAVQVPRAGVGRELALGEVARHVADHALLVGQEDAVRCHGAGPQSRSKAASTGVQATPLIGRMSCGQQEKATMASISARSTT